MYTQIFKLSLNTRGDDAEQIIFMEIVRVYKSFRFISKLAENIAKGFPDSPYQWTGHQMTTICPVKMLINRASKRITFILYKCVYQMWMIYSNL